MATETTMETENTEEEFIPGFKDVNAFSKQALRAFMMATKSSNDLPSSGDDFDYYSSFPAFRDIMEMESTRILQLIQEVMRYHGAKGNVSSTSETVEIEDRFDFIVDANDQLLERIGNFLDEASGVRKKEAPLVIASMTPRNPISGSWNKKINSTAGKKSLSSYKLLTARNIQRPQLKFKDTIDNSPTPFVPKIKHKPNAIVPIPESIFEAQAENKVHSIRSEEFTGEEMSFPHPYETELDNFNPDFSDFQKVEPQEPGDLEKTPLTFITTLTELMNMCDALKLCKEIAVDLEHHSYRTFQGITCLMQISTRTNDYIIDTLELRSELHILNEVFTDPKIVKVFHGADSDIEWLQRDLGLYVVNMFDTGQASRMMGFAQFSFAFMLRHYCGLEADKQYQMADWRIRPLPEELIKYARSDTHYLLYMYDRARNDLLERSNQQGNLLQSVVQRSKQICLKRYVKPRLRPDDHLNLYRRNKKAFNARQLMALQELYVWRDRTARSEDESIGFVLPNHMMLQIAEILPKEQTGIIACCNPVPPLVRQSVQELLKIVTSARELPLDRMESSKPKVSLPSKDQHPKYNLNNTLRCPHDTSHDSSVAMEMPCLIDQEDVDKKLLKKAFVVQPEFVEVRKTPLLSVFSKQKIIHNNASAAHAEKIKNSFIHPMAKFLPPELAKGLEIAQTMVLPSKLSSAGGLSLHPTTIPWKLLPHTKTEEKPKTKITKAVPRALIGNEAMISFKVVGEGKGRKQNEEEEEEEEPKSVRPVPPWVKDSQNQKRKAEKTLEEVEKKKEKPEVEVYDYSTADYSLLGGGPSSSKGKKHYDPNKIPDHKFKKHRASNLNPMRGKKSASFGGKGNKLGKIEWPKGKS